MRIKHILEHQNKGISFEFFPPKTEAGEKQLFDTIRRLQAFEPGFVSVTYGAGGSTRKNTRHVIERIVQETALSPMPHVTCIGESDEGLRGMLRDYQELGVENILALRGDLPEGETGLTADATSRHGIDVVKLAASFKAFSIGVAVYPEGHAEASSLESDLLYTKQKIEAGADFAITQMFFDNRFFYDLVEKAGAVGIRIPIIPGIMPITDVAKIKRFTQTCGATLPTTLIHRMENASSPDEVERMGIEFATRQCEDLWQNGVRFFHFYTLNRGEAITRILHNLSLNT